MRITDPQRAWRRLRRDGLAHLAATHTLSQIAELFGLHKTTVYKRLQAHGLKAKAHEYPAPDRPTPAERIKRCPAHTLTGPCAAPLDADGTCRWAHQHTPRGVPDARTVHHERNHHDHPGRTRPRAHRPDTPGRRR